MIEAMNLKDRDVERNLKLAEELNIEEVKLFKDYDIRPIRIGKNQPNNFKQKLIKLLKKYHECFAWIVTNMPRIDPKISC